jgi:hypothetical protein
VKGEVGEERRKGRALRNRDRFRAAAAITPRREATWDQLNKAKAAVQAGAGAGAGAGGEGGGGGVGGRRFQQVQNGGDNLVCRM